MGHLGRKSLQLFQFKSWPKIHTFDFPRKDSYVSIDFIEIVKKGREKKGKRKREKEKEKAKRKKEKEKGKREKGKKEKRKKGKK